MKRKELFKRLTAVSMSAMMAVTMMPATAFASEDGFFADEQEVVSEAVPAAEEAAVTEETPVADTEVSAEDDLASQPETSQEDDFQTDDFQSEENGFGAEDAFTGEEGEEADELSDFLADPEASDEDQTEETTKASDAEISLTVNQNGVPALAKDGSAMLERSVTVTDINNDGKLTYDEALIAAHNEYYEGGSSAGYLSEEGDYGLALKKLWGDSSGAFGYWDNDNSCWSLSDEVADGDELTAFVYKDQKNWTDAYTRFENGIYMISTDIAWTPALERAIYNNETNGYTFESFTGATLVAYDSDRKLLSTDLYTVDGDSVTFTKIGTYYLVAQGTDSMTLVPSVTKVIVGRNDQTAVTAVNFRYTELTYPLGTKLIAKPTLEPTDCKNVVLTWSSSNPEVATVDQNGTVQSLSVGETVISASTGKVTGEFTFKVTEVPELSDLKFFTSSEAYDNGGAPLELTPAFDGKVYEGYTITLADYVSSLYTEAIFAPETLANGYDTVFLNNKWSSWSGAFAHDGVATGDSVITKDNTLTPYVQGATPNQRYKISVSRYPTLSNLVIDGIVSPEFDKDVYKYHAFVDGQAAEVEITPTAFDSSYEITINGESVKSGSSFKLPYKWDENNKMEVSIVVKNEKSTTSTYTVELEKIPLNDAPHILMQPKGAEYIENDTVAPLSVQASADGELAYQWYSNDKNSTEDGTKIENATEATYTPSSEKAGTTYYYCVVTNTGKAENNTTASDCACIVVDPDPTPVATLTNPGNALPDDGYEYSWNKGYVYTVGQETVPLEVKATSKAEGGTFSYQWRAVNRPYNNFGWSSVNGDSTSATYTPGTTIMEANNGGSYYGCEVTYKFKGKTYTTWATTGETHVEGEGDNTKTYDVIGVYVFVKADEVSVPEITKQPVSAEYTVGDTMSSLSVSASKEDGGSLTYQWFVNDTESTENGTAVTESSFSSYYRPERKATQIGTKYYYCVVTNTLQGRTATVVSDAAKITIKEESSGEDLIAGKLHGSGTEEDPYLIRNAQDYLTVAELVAQGVSFDGMFLRQERNITLPSGWKPIGVTKDGTNNIKNGANLNPFSGTLEGNGKTITIPAGGLPLLGYVKGATVRNLNIYGQKIDGYGLVNNFEGVGLSGNAIIIDNVTLKSGSSTLKSGFLGANITTNGFAGCSAGFVATIQNCTIESGVVIGYNKDQNIIGSFAGRMQGTVENCVSHATVYGTSYVGGIIGSRDNAMGNCAVTGCTFDGTVEASSDHAGGIAGGGYTNSTAPNGIRIAINDCISTGTIIGKDKVGGILGGDSFVTQAWNSYNFKGNAFDGTVKATEGTYVGGVIGYYESLDVHDNVAHNHYSANCGATKGIGWVNIVDTNCETHETKSGAKYVNTDKYHRTDDPLGADAEKLTTTKDISEPYVIKLELSGDYKTDFYLDEDLDLTGLVVKAIYDDGNEKEVALSDLKITGYDNTKHGNQTLTLEYGGEKTQINIRVLRKGDDIKVTFQLLGDTKHGDSKEIHTLADNNLTGWIPAEDYTVDTNATVYDVIQVAANEFGFEVLERDTIYGTYIYGIEYKGTKLEEFDNGQNSGWMYTLNGEHPDLGVAAQYLNDGDIIVFHYTDDYQKEDPDQRAADAVSAVIQALPDAADITLENRDAVAEARKAYDELTDTQKELVSAEVLAKLTAAEEKIAEILKPDGHEHVFDEGKITKESTCKEAGVKTYTCSICGFEKTEEIPKTENHTFDNGKVTKEATCKEEGVKTYTCTICGTTKTEAIAKTTTHTFDEGKVTKEATYKETGIKTYTCKICGFQKTETIPVMAHTHDYTWKVTSKATVFQPEKQKGTCTICGDTVTRSNGSKLKATIKLNTKSIVLQKKQTTDKVKVSGLAKGDSVKSWKSSNKKIVTVNKNGVITAKNKKGSATITVTLKSGKKAEIKVTVQTAKVKTTKITGLDKKVTVKKGKKLTLKPVIKPITSLEGVTYTSSDKKIASVSKKGVIIGKKKGTAKITVKSGKKKFTVTVKVK